MELLLSKDNLSGQVGDDDGTRTLLDRLRELAQFLFGLAATGDVGERNDAGQDAAVRALAHRRYRDRWPNFT